MVRGIDLDCGGNPGAIGLYFNEAQNSSIENVKIFAAGAFAGFRGIPGAASIMVNIEVEGGQYGIYTNSNKAAGCVIAGAKLRNQTVNAVRYDGFVPLVLVGFEIVTPANSTQAAVTIVKNPGGARANASGVSLIDGIIRLGGNPTVAAIDNPEGKNFYARNVYISRDGASNLVKSYLADTTTGTGYWKRINEYSYCDQAGPDSFDNGEGLKESFSLVGAALTPNKTPSPLNNGVIAAVTSNAGSPPGDLVSRHTWFALPSVDDLDKFDVSTAGIIPAVNEDDPRVVDHGVLQILINSHRKIFLPKGIYRLTGPINLKADTILFGADRNLTRIEVAQGWSDDIAETKALQIETSVITTDNSSTATTYLGDLSIGVHCGKPPTGPESLPDPSDWFTALDWRAGKDSMVHIGQVYREPYAVMPRWKTNKHSLIRIHQLGGGRWYHLGAVKAHTSEDPDYRILKVENTTQPLWIYGLNPEHPRGCDAYVEFNNAKNVRIYSVKSEFTEDRALGIDSLAAKSVALKFIKSQNIAIFGYGAIRNGVNNRGIIEFIDSARVLAALIAPERKRFGTSSDDTIRELKTEDVLPTRKRGVTFPHVVALYKDGEITGTDEMQMTHSDSFYGMELSFPSVEGEDGWIVAGTPSTVNTIGPLRVGDNAANKQYRSILSFVTTLPSSHPDLVAVAATLSLRRNASAFTYPAAFGRLKADIKTMTFGGTATLVSDDFNAAPTYTDVIPAFPVPAASSVNEYELASGLTAINPGGRTQLRIYFANPTDSDSAADALEFFGGGGPLVNQPILTVRYTQP